MVDRARDGVPHIVVAGGGAAATEALFVLREHAGGRVRVTVVTPAPGFEPRALPIAEPFSPTRRHRRSMRVLARDMGAELRYGRVAAVEGHRRRVVLSDGDTVDYDALVLAVGARPRRMIDNALTLYGEAGVTAVERVLVEVDAGRPAALAFVVPPGVTRAVSLYELAVQVGLEARVRGMTLDLRLYSPEIVPLASFERNARADMRVLLGEAGVRFVGSASVFEGIDGLPRDGATDTRLPPARVVALPVLGGPALPGVPCTGDGFIPIDGLGQVPGMDDVFAAGDATACAIKHVDVACAQAGAAADVLAARAGAPLRPRPWRPAVCEHRLIDHGLGVLAPRDVTLSRGA